MKQLWAQLKNIIKNIYHTIPNENFVLFLLESEFRRNINLLSLNERWEEIFNALNFVKNLKITTFYSVEELLEITKKKFNLITINLINNYMILEIKFKKN